MLLAFDIGNTNLTLGAWRGEELVYSWRFATRRDATGDELAALFWSAFASRGLNFSDFSALVVCSVVPSLTSAAVFFGREHAGIEPLVVSHESELGLSNAYEDPRAVGADRLVNALGARELAGSERGAVIADFGTATTVDAVGADGAYLGGAIAPGIGVSSEALRQAAAKLPRVELAAPPRVLATNTTHSIQAGLVFGYAGLTKELVARAVQELEARDGVAPLVLATGGLSSLIAPLVPQIERIEPDLTLRGLKRVWERGR